MYACIRCELHACMNASTCITIMHSCIHVFASAALPRCTAESAESGSAANRSVEASC